jgi:hypothetical protein
MMNTAYSKCIDIAGSSVDNLAPVTAYDCTNNGNQLFALDNKQRLVVKHSNKCLDIKGADPAEGTPIIQWECSDSANQKWTKAIDGSVKSSLNGLCLGFNNGENGSPLVTKKCDLGSQVHWVP